MQSRFTELMQEESSFHQRLNSITIPSLKAEYDWKTFRNKIATGELFIYFYHNNDKLKKYSPVAFNGNIKIVLLKYVLVLALLIYVITTKTYLSLFVYSFAVLSHFLMFRFKEKRRLILSITWVVILILSYFLKTEWYITIASMIIASLSYSYQQGHDDGMKLYALLGEENFFQLYLEDMVIMKIKDRKYNVDYVKSLRKELFINSLEEFNRQHGTNHRL